MWCLNDQNRKECELTSLNSESTLSAYKDRVNGLLGLKLFKDGGILQNLNFTGLQQSLAAESQLYLALLSIIW